MPLHVQLVNTTWSIGYLEAGIGLGDTSGRVSEVRPPDGTLHARERLSFH